jgi:hypothetical protein
MTERTGHRPGDDSRDVARLDEAMRVERRRKGTDWTEDLKRGLDKRFDSGKSPPT